MIRFPASILLLAVLLHGCCPGPLTPAPEPPKPGESSEAALGRHGLSRPELLRAAARGRAIALVRATRVEDGATIFGDRFVTTYFTAIKTYRPGRWSDRPILPHTYFADVSNLWHTAQLLEKEHEYLVVLDMGKWPLLDRCIEVKGIDDPIVEQAEAWLGEPPPRQP